jgi:hypothetical protein
MEVIHMASDRSTTPSPSEIPVVVDDLKRIKGLGQGVETRLNQAGIFSFARLAASSPAQISELLADMIGMSPEKVQEQDWIGQARRFAAQAKADESIKISMSQEDRQRYETFSVKLLVDEGNQIRRTNIVHVQKGAEENWAGWDETRLIAFVVEHAGLNVTAARTTVQMEVESVPAGEADIAPSPAETVQTSARHAHHHHERTLTIDGMDICEKGSTTPSNIIASEKNWSIRLAWTLSGFAPLYGDWLVKVYLESIGPGEDYVLPHVDGVRQALLDGDMKAPNVYSYFHELKFKADEIAPGIYWLVVTIAWEKHPGKLGDLMGFSEKSMLQFYER